MLNKLWKSNLMCALVHARVWVLQHLRWDWDTIFVRLRALESTWLLLIPEGVDNGCLVRSRPENAHIYLSKPSNPANTYRFVCQYKTLSNINHPALYMAHCRCCLWYVNVPFDKIVSRILNARYCMLMGNHSDLRKIGCDCTEKRIIDGKHV